MKALELRKLSLKDLGKKLQEARNDLFQMRFQNAVGQLEKKSKLRDKRREIGRILTIITEQKA